MTRPRHLPDPVQPGSGLGSAAAGRDQLAVQLGELLLVQQSTPRVDDAAPGLEHLHLLVGLQRLVLQLGQPRFLPVGGLAGGRVTHRELVGEVGVHQPVGEPRRQDGRARLGSDLDDVGQADPVRRHRALEDTVERARHYGAMACDALGLFPDSRWKRALTDVVAFCIDRSH